MTPVIENFIAKLASNLSTLSDSEQRYALDFYRTFLLDGDFQTKEEIIKELGTPNSLANEIKQDYVKFLTAVMSSANNPHASDNYFNGLRVKKYPRRERVLSFAGFDQVQLAVHSTDIIIHLGDKFQVLVADYSSRPIEVSLMKQTLLIKEGIAKEKNHVVMFNRLTSASRIEITVPQKDSLAKISGHSRNGDIMVQNLQLDNITFNLRTGDLYLNNVHVTGEVIFSGKNSDNFITQSEIAQLSSRIHDGDSSFKRSIIKQAIVQTRDGDLEIKQCHINSNLEAADGDINITQTQLEHQNNIRMADGDLNLHQITHDTGVQLDVKDGDIIYHNSSIGNKFTSQTKQGDLLKASVRDGDIFIK